MSLQVFMFGTVAIMQLFLKNRAGFLASRFALGLAESGYIPGAAYTLSTWYVKKELSKRTAVLFFGMFGGNAISPLLASGILKLGGRGGLKGWQWLFMRKYTPTESCSKENELTRLTVEGLATICIAILLFFFLPGSPDIPKPLMGPGIVRFSAEEQETLQGRLEKDDEGKRPGAHGMHIDLKLVWRTVSHYKRWPTYVSAFCVFSTWSPLTTYTPSIIM